MGLFLIETSQQVKRKNNEAKIKKLSTFFNPNNFKNYL